MKKVIVLLVDSLIPSVLERCMRERLVPAFQFLVDHGQYWSNCVTVFPTMTASVDSSLLTGVFPDKHRVPGLIWYDPEAKEMINYINDWKCLYKQGITTIAKNVLYYLNEKHLSQEVTTLFEDLANRGVTSASINLLVHRGAKEHRLKLPYFMDLATGFQLRDPISGPDFLTLGRLIPTPFDSEFVKKYGKFSAYCGINDDYAVQMLRRLIQSEQLPDVTLVYLPDNDHQIHQKSPDNAESALIQIDQRIQVILRAFGSWETALNQSIFIVTSDHGQTRIGKGKHYLINLDQLLQSFRGLSLGEKAQGHDFVLCNNERMAYLYPLKPNMEQAIIQTLSHDSRIDLLAVKQGNGVWVKECGSNREMFFAPDGPYVDRYGAKWALFGDLSVLDLTITEQQVDDGDYPDGLARLYGALYSQEVPMIVITARPRYQFASRGCPVHLGGGAHGSLHRYDSLVPLLIAGTDQTFQPFPRIVDLKDYLLQFFP